MTVAVLRAWIMPMWIFLGGDHDPASFGDPPFYLEGLVGGGRWGTGFAGASEPVSTLGGDGAGHGA